MRSPLVLVLVLSLVFCAVSDASAQDRRLTVVVADPSGATIPGASITVLEGSDLIGEQDADAKGVALITVRTNRTLTLIVTAPGFATEEVDVIFPPRATTHQITVSLPLAPFETGVAVAGAEPAEAGGLTETLSQAEIDQLPDDPDELQRMLEEIAGPGATIRVDGFSGGRLPTPDQIARIVVRRDAFSAEFHDVGRGRVEIATRPGVERWRGNAGLNVRPSGLSARNAASAVGSKAGTMVRMNAFAAGPLVRNRVSFSASVQGSSSEDTRGISALTLEGPYVATLTQPFDSRSVSVRTEGLLTRQTMFRTSYERSTSERGNQGISELDFPERGYTNERVRHELRFALEGGQRRPYHLRLQFDQARTEAIPDTLERTIVVQSAFRRGGASTTGVNRGRSLLSDTMFTVVARPYTLRVGSLINYDSNEQGQLRNSLGTFTFTDLASFAAGIPATFTQRRGAQPLTVGVTQAATFAQAEFVKWRWTVGVGLRYELQSGIDDRAALAPRVGLSRSFRRNTTTFRAGYGWFYDWMPVRVEEESIRLSQGSTEEEVIIRNPSYPDPFAAGSVTTRRDPPTRLDLARGAQLPRWQRVSVGLNHQLREGMRINFDTFYESTGNGFRSLDLNAPVNGVRPDSNFGRVLLVQSIGRERRVGFNVNLNVSPRQGMFSSVRYGWTNNMNDADDAFTPPATGDFATEWARTRQGRHRINWNIGVPIPWLGLVASINGRWNSGGYYNWTTGHDDNGDAYFNDRPVGVTRSSLQASATTQTDMRLSWTLPSMRPGGSALLQRGPGGGSRGSGGRGAGSQRRFEIYLWASNLFNRVNKTGFVGVESSPLFMQATSAQAARRVEMGWRFSF
ncbi:MAG TPA: TonB-dependent receptor [Vicinamibacterales bacterium]|nr:TonB-dependent receptor [Vicinamibacterales bacterium]